MRSDHEKKLRRYAFWVRHRMELPPVSADLHIPLSLYTHTHPFYHVQLYEHDDIVTLKSYEYNVQTFRKKIPDFFLPIPYSLSFLIGENQKDKFKNLFHMCRQELSFITPFIKLIITNKWKLTLYIHLTIHLLISFYILMSNNMGWLHKRKYLTFSHLTRSYYYNLMKSYNCNFSLWPIYKLQMK